LAIILLAQLIFRSHNKRLEQIIGLRNCETKYKSSEIIYVGVEVLLLSTTATKDLCDIRKSPTEELDKLLLGDKKIESLIRCGYTTRGWASARQ
jgi:hypothetical protein